MTTPDLWMIYSIYTPEHGRIDKVVASWFGGFARGQSWRMSSGITKIVDQEGYYEIHNASGSIYKCYKESEGASSYTYGIMDTYTDALAEMSPDSYMKRITINEVQPLEIL